MAEAMLDAGIEQLSATPPAVPPIAFQVLARDRRRRPRLAQQAAPAREAAEAPASSSWPNRHRRWSTRDRRHPAAAGPLRRRRRDRRGAGHQVSRREVGRHPGRSSPSSSAAPGHTDAAKATLAEAHEARSRRRRVAGPAGLRAQRRRPGRRRRPDPPRRCQARAQQLEIYDWTCARHPRQVRPQRRSDQDLRGHAEAVRRQRRGRQAGLVPGLSVVYVNMGNYRQGRGRARDRSSSATPTRPGPTTTWATSMPSRGRTSRRPSR